MFLKEYRQMFSVQCSISSKSLVCSWKKVSMAVLAINGLSISVGICQRHHRWLFWKTKGVFNFIFIQMSPSEYRTVNILPLNVHIDNRIIYFGYTSISLLLLSTDYTAAQVPPQWFTWNGSVWIDTRRYVLP